MKALSIRQPWAWAIVAGHKSIENRDWNTNFRGEFLIHTGQSYENDGKDFLLTQFITPPDKQVIERGGFIGIAELTHVVHERDQAHLTTRDKPWFFGEYGFILEKRAPYSI